MNQQKLKRIQRVRAKIKGIAERPRLAVFRSLDHISAQLIDDGAGRTLASMRDMDLSQAEREGKKKTEVAQLVGKELGVRAKEKGITTVVFDRRDKRYHGRVCALADGARESGLIF